MLEGMNKHEAFLAVGVVVGAGLLVLFMKNKATGSAPSSSGAAALVGGYTTAQTVYVPTTSYDIHYDTNNGTIVNATSPNGQPETIYMPGSANNQNNAVTNNAYTTNTSTTNNTIAAQYVSAPPSESPAPHIATTSPAKVNPVTTPKHVIYTAKGQNWGNSSLWGLSYEYVKYHINGGKEPTNAQIQSEVNHVAAVNHVANPNKIRKGQTFIMN